MSETLNPEHLASEIADLSKRIEAKRQELEQANGVLIEDKEAVAAVVKDELLAPVSTDEATSLSPKPVLDDQATGQAGDYLDNLDEETIETVNALIGQISTQGFIKTAALAKNMSPYYLDIFHDALVTRLYDELKAKGLLK
jgi:hypothetical protein